MRRHQSQLQLILYWADQNVQIHVSMAILTRTAAALSSCVLFCIFLAGEASAQQCADLFTAANGTEKAWAQASEQIKTLTWFERVTGLLKAYNGGVVRRTQADIRMKIPKVGFYLANGEINPIVDMYRATFRSVELAIARVPLIDQRLEKLVELGQSENAEAKSLRSERLKLLKNFGANYGEYMYVRDILQRVADGATDVADIANAQLPVMEAAMARPLVEPAKPLPLPATGFRFLPLSEIGKADVNPDCPISQNTAKAVLKSLGISNLQKLFRDAGLGTERPDIKDVKAYFSSHPEAVAGMLRSAFLRELRAAAHFTFLENEGVANIKRVIGGLPAPLRKSFEVLLFFRHTQYLKNRFADPIDQYVIHQIGDANGRLQNLIALNKAFSGDEVILAFAQIIERAESWRVLKAAAKELSDKPDATIYEREIFAKMEEAEAKAQRTGQSISLIFDSSSTHVLGGIIWALAYGLWDDDTRSQIFGGFDRALQEVKSKLPLKTSPSAPK